MAGNYFINRAEEKFNKLQKLDFDYCFEFYECLKSYYEKLNPNIGNLDSYLVCLCSDVVSFDATSIIGDCYVYLQSGNLIVSGTKPGRTVTYPFRFENGTLWFSEEAYILVINNVQPKGNDLKEKLKKSFSGSPSTFIKKVIELAKPEVFNQAYCKIVNDICFDLAKSITIGEYFILDNYSDDILENLFRWELRVENNPKLEKDLPGLIKHLLNNIGTIAFKIRSMSRTIGKILENQASYIEERHPIRVEGFKDAMSFSHGETANQSIASTWGKAVEAISLISYIDFAFFSTYQNIETLDAAREVLLELWRRNPDPVLKSEIIFPNITKASILLHKCLSLHDEKDRDIERNVLLHDSSIDKEIRKKDNFHNLPQRKHNLSKDDFEIFGGYKTSVEGHRDLSLYAKVGDGYHNLKTGSEAVREIADKHYEEINEADLSVIEKNLKTDWTASVLIKTVRNLSCWAEMVKDSDLLQRVYQAVKELLSKLENLYIEYRSGNLVPGKIVTPFEGSFYELTCIETTMRGCISGYEICNNTTVCDYRKPETFEKRGIAFMQSIAVDPVPLNFIERFINKYSYSVSKIASNLQVLKIKDLMGEENKKLQEIGNLQKEVKSNQSHTLQLLGILGAFIALVSVGANAIGNVPIDRFFSFLIVVTLCIAALLVCISVIFEEKHWVKYVILSILALVLVLSILELNFNWPIKIDANSVNSCICTGDRQNDTLILKGDMQELHNLRVE